MVNIKKTGSKEYGNRITALICGQSGAGKTLFSSTAPNVLYASAEAGLMSVADRDLPFFEVTSLNDLNSIRTMLNQPADIREKQFGFPVDTLVIDTIDEVQKIVIRELLDKERKATPELRQWGIIADHMRQVIRSFRNIPDLNLIMTCHVSEQVDNESGSSHYKPALQGAIATEITGLVDFALLMTSRQVLDAQGDELVKKQVRYLQTTQDGKYPWIKDRSGKLPAEFIVNFEDDFVRMQELVFGKGKGSSADIAKSESELDRQKFLSEMREGNKVQTTKQETKEN